ncbi:thioredoxin-related transmembrane protein 2 [Phtheirospermum japonicum]|uniref:Thioredoxin-related transmembrane protein 2 n=1 Tax=Phtheirospermum japonicum TaxID=374723 RepID=A0A830CNS6_9LAMI|nr:thioredoxin-related transmembrane protein 2 [Phtheirospermum japonicum]
MSSNNRNWMNRMVSEPYYLLHFLAFFSYIPLRCSAAQVLSPLRSAHLLHREIQALLVFCVLAAIKVVKTESWEAFTSDILLSAKIFLAAIALVMDYHLALWYAVAFLGTTNQLTPLQLETLLTEGSTSRFWMVEFRSLSTSSCIRSSSFFPELSITFSNKNLSFGIIDIGLFPNVAEKFGITLGSLHQLPTYILFHDGAVISRLPEMDYEAKVFDSPVSKRLVCRHFELDKLFLDYINVVSSFSGPTLRACDLLYFFAPLLWAPTTSCRLTPEPAHLTTSFHASTYYDTRGILFLGHRMCMCTRTWAVSLL